MLTDVHVHLLSPRNRLDPPEAFEDEGEILRAEMTVPHARAVWQRASLEELLDDMAQSGVQRSLVFGFPWRNPQRCAWDNEYVEQCVRAHPQRLRGLAVFQPGLPGAPEEVTARLASGCFAGVKIKAQWQGHCLSDSQLWRAVLEIVQAQRGLALVHVEQSLKPPRGNGPHELLQLARAFPELKIIAAHFGAMLGLYEPYEPAARLLKNVLYDTAMGAPGPVAAAYQAAGVGDKMIFGSDFPMHSPAKLLAQLPEETRERIGSLNFSSWWP
jgi:predicted TIM-barrel fold metal-dependent hydrolase